MKRLSVDWKLAAGFSTLLLLIVAIGLIGIFQIQSLSERVNELGRYYFSLQKIALEMRINVSLYATGIRNYTYWRSFRYLEAARDVSNRKVIDTAKVAFDNQLAKYASVVKTSDGKKWIGEIKKSQEELRSIGDRIIDLADQLEDAKGTAKREELEASINKLIMVFENRLYRIDDFIEGSIQKTNLEGVEEELYLNELARKRAQALLLWSLIFGLAVGGETALLIYRNRRHERQRRQRLVHRMIRIEEQERGDLSLQIHNQMGQDLSALKIYLDIIDKNSPDVSKKVKEDILKGKKILSGLVDKSHNIAELLRPPALDEIGLIDTISDLIEQYKKMSGIKISYYPPKQTLKLSGEHSLLLYRIIQEGLTNIITHAKAKNVNVNLEVKNKVIRLRIQDDGVGFDYKRVFLKPPSYQKDKRQKLGLLVLKEHVELLDGLMNIKTAPDKKGTLLSVELPMTKRS